MAATSSAGAGDIDPATSGPSAQAVERAITCAVLGLAVGDALGTSVEFSARGTFEPVQDITGGGPFLLEKGQWTDDTSMALCMMASLLETRKFEPRDIMVKFQKWANEGYMSSNGRCFDIGRATATALHSYTEGGSPYCGNPDPHQAGNGSLMRLAPVPLCYWQYPEFAIHLAALSSIITHSAPTCIDACRYFAGLLIGALRGESKETLLSPMYSPVPGYWDEREMVEEISKIAQGEYKTKEEEDISGAGWVVSTLEAVLWAFFRTNNFKDGLLLVVNLGDDTDTTGAIYGQIAGCYYSQRDGGIPQEWVDVVTMSDQISKWSSRLAEQSMEWTQARVKKMMQGLPPQPNYFNVSANGERTAAGDSRIVAGAGGERPSKICGLL
eukprot:TRINITY_DN5864_c0_g1_i1.p1 TRINITY_DN5864_c0_g1~~TRINITY_DN5864_c0_g1_i1.p1  ORF type:complete len:384 (-),score=37.51 TRINITY_DN5864_c0_g1_i1:126-1277(-)